MTKNGRQHAAADAWRRCTVSGLTVAVESRLAAADDAGVGQQCWLASICRFSFQQCDEWIERNATLMKEVLIHTRDKACCARCWCGRRTRLRSVRRISAQKNSGKNGSCDGEATTQINNMFAIPV